MSVDYKGYSQESSGKFRARINENGKYICLGVYDTEEDATIAYQEACEDRLKRSVEKYGHDLKDGILYDENYIVFDNGDIFALDGHKMKTKLNSRGYPRCNINGHYELIHRIVAECFIPNYLNKPCVNHRNGIKTDNDAKNLEWCTYQENSCHAHENKLINYAYGERNPNTTLTVDDVHYIRSHYKPRDREYSMKLLAKKFNVSISTIYNITHDKRWNHVK